MVPGHTFLSAIQFMLCNLHQCFITLGLTCISSGRFRFEDATRQPFVFNSEGESNRGYHIYTVR